MQLLVNRRCSILAAALLVLGNAALGQRASNWRVYRVADGLQESACFSVSIGPRGNVIARQLSTPTLGFLDGYDVKTFPAPESGNGRIYESPAGQLWAVGSEGLVELKDGNWLSHPVPEIAAEVRSNSMHSIHLLPIMPVRQGRVLYLLSNQLMEFNFEDDTNPRSTVLRKAKNAGLGVFTGMIPSRDGGMWISGTHGLLKLNGSARNLKPDAEWIEFRIPDALQIQNLAEPREDTDGEITAVAESVNGPEKYIAHFDGHSWTARPGHGAKLRFAWRDIEGGYWAATIDGLLQWNETSQSLMANEEISPRQLFDVAVEQSGAFWLATSEGLFRYAPRTWRNPVPIRNVTTPVRCLAEDREDTLWFITGHALQSLKGANHAEYSPTVETAAQLQESRAIYPLKDGSLLLESADGLRRLLASNGSFKLAAFDAGKGRVNPLGLSKDGSLIVWRDEGTGEGRTGRIEVLDGSGFRQIGGNINISDATNAPQSIYVAQNGDIWLGWEHRLSWWHEMKWQPFNGSDKAGPLGARGFVEMADGKIWCATEDKIWQFDGKTWLMARGGFDRINDILRTHDGTVWVASDNGLTHYCQGAWIDNGVEEGLPGGAVERIYEDHHGRLWAACSRGLSLNHPEIDTDPPRTAIQTLPEKEGAIPEGGSVSPSFTGQDKWKYTTRDRLLFSYRLDDREWSYFQEGNNASFSDLSAGRHFFKVRALDRNGNLDTNPAQIELMVALPWFKETRLVAISCVALLVAIFLGGLAFNRHRQLVRSYAEVERKVAERTRELEIANRELLHSQKMNALGTLAAGIAHDFNNILSIIKGSAQLIEDNLENPQKVQTRVDRIKTVVEQGAGIIKAMLGFSRSSDQQPSLCDLTEVLDETIRLLGDRFLREIELTVQRAPELPRIAASKDFVQQILLNFIFNAAEAMTKRKRIVLSTNRSPTLPAGMVLMPDSATEYVSVSVQDFGCGIPPETMPRIFEPFFTTKAFSARRGTGLGLSMAYELAKQMEAGLAVVSVLNEGSTFTLILPVHESPVEIKTASTQTHAT